METLKYFDWTFDPTCVHDLFLGEPELPSGEIVDAWRLKQCEPFVFNGEELRVHADKIGSMSNICFGAFDLPYVTPALANALSSLAGDDIQWVPVRVIETGIKLYILNALREVSCVDEFRSTFTKWVPENMERPDKVGQYRSFGKLCIDSNLVGGFEVFRPWGWRVVLIVSDRARKVAESIGVKGSIFLPT